VLVSEEVDEPIVIDEKVRGSYNVVFDPLDGSSNIECNISIGTIFGIYKAKQTDSKLVGNGLSEVLRPGNELVVAGYCMYGSTTQFVVTFGKGVHIFTLELSSGEFVLAQRDVKIPEQPKTIYSINEGHAIFPT